MIFFFLLLLPVLSFAEGDIVPGNEFEFAVSLQYDVEPQLIGQGVYLGNSNLYWGTYPLTAEDDLNLAYSSVTSNSYELPVVWTNYDTNGLPGEIFDSFFNSSLSSNGYAIASWYRVGFDGAREIIIANRSDQEGTVVSVPIPYITGKGASASTFQDVVPISYPTTDTLFTLDGVRAALRVNSLEQGSLKTLYSSLADGVYQLLHFVDDSRVRLRNFFASICTSIAFLHLIWASAVVGSGIFRAVVAGITGISGGGK